MPSKAGLARLTHSRWALALSLTLMLQLLQIVLPTVLGIETWWRLAYFVIVSPLLLFVLTAQHEWLERCGQLRVGRMVCLSVATSLLIGASTGLIYFVVVVEPLQLAHLHRVTHGMVAGLGAFNGVVMCGIWTLGFLYPCTAHNAGLRTLELQAQTLEAEKLKLEASQLRIAAELSLVRAQLEPHFLFNTLNSIAGLVTQRPREARRLLGCLGDLLRNALSDGDQLQTLDLEVSWLKRYAEILESRHAGFLSFRWHVQDDVRHALVPRLLLQPLLENAVNHGALCRSGGGEVTLRASLERSGNDAFQVVCIVEDNGPGMPDTPLRAGAFGLRSVQRRLELEFQGATLDIESTRGGTRSVVRLPHLLEHAPWLAS